MYLNEDPFGYLLAKAYHTTTQSQCQKFKRFQEGICLLS